MSAPAATAKELGEIVEPLIRNDYREPGGEAKAALASLVSRLEKAEEALQQIMGYAEKRRECHIYIDTLADFARAAFSAPAEEETR